MTSRDPQRCCEAVRSAILATAWLLVYLSLRDIEGYEQDTTVYVPIRNIVRVRYVYGKFLPYTYRVDFVELATFIVRNRLTDRYLVP